MINQRKITLRMLIGAIIAYIGMRIYGFTNAEIKQMADENLAMNRKARVQA